MFKNRSPWKESTPKVSDPKVDTDDGDIDGESDPIVVGFPFPVRRKEGGRSGVQGEIVGRTVQHPRVT